MNDDAMKEREALAREILEKAPRLSVKDKFKFACHPGVPCFNACCGNVNITLTPLDVLRMSRRLNMSTSDFLAKYTFVPFSEDQKLPFVFLRMMDNDKKSCPFVKKDGCSVYSDRPWPCRMYPVGQAAPGDPGVQGEGFYFLMHEDHCKGYEEDREWTVAEWTENQGVGEYEEAGELFKKLLLHPYLSQKELDPARMEMFYMACYDLDKFRRFVFESPFLRRFKLEEGLEDKLRSDDIELMRFAFRWLRFAIFGEMTIEVNKELLSEREVELLKSKQNV